MFMTTVTIDKAVTMLIAVVKEFGKDHTARGSASGGCQYVVTPSPTLPLVPVCIIGQVFANLGILRAMLTDNGNDQFGACSLDSPIWHNAEEMGVTFTDDARHFLRCAQNYQDSPSKGGQAWGGALSYALAEAQERVVEEARASAVVFSGWLTTDVRQATTDVRQATMDDPLADWERELLGS